MTMTPAIPESSVADSNLKLSPREKIDSLISMAASVAHDFSNHLTAILGNTNLLLEQLDADSPLRGNAAQIERSARLALELTQQLITFTGRFRPEKRPVHLASLIAQMQAELKALLTKNITLKYALADNVPLIAADSNHIRTVLMNLVANAVEALRDREGTITVSLAAVECDCSVRSEQWLGARLSPGLHADLAVEDTGCGMPPEIMKRIFDPFFTTKIRGRGMGLSLVLGIVRAHEGAIRVYSVPEKGSVFQILFPAARV